MESKAHEYRETMREVEALHARNLAEQQALNDANCNALEVEKRALQQQLATAVEQIERLERESARLQTRVDALDSERPVLAGVAQLFALTLPPLVVQVNDLLAQKRLLARELAELLATQQQVECIGHVLQQLLPVSDSSAAASGGATAGDDTRSSSSSSSRRRQRCVARFRRAVVAVFALNRLQRLGTRRREVASDSVAGVGVSLQSWSASASTSSQKPETSRRRRRHSAMLPREPEPVIKVLPPSASRLSVDAVVQRLQSLALDLPAQLTALADDSESADKIGACVLRVLHALVPETTSAVQHSLCAGFHCDALLARRRPPARERPRGRRSTGTTTLGGDEVEEGRDDEAEGTAWSARTQSSESIATMPRGAACVTLIRRRVLALGKRVEDLHFQRNALQKENYELQYQLEQHAMQLKDMDALVEKTHALEHEISSLRDQHETHEDSLREELHAKSRELEAAARDLQKREQEIAALRQEASQRETHQREMQRELDNLAERLTALQSATQASEDERQQSQAAMARQSDELRHLRQAARKAHVAHQQVTAQLEEEMAVTASLRELVERLRSQQETLEAQVQHATERGLKAAARQNGTERGNYDTSGSESPSSPPEVSESSLGGSMSTSAGQKVRLSSMRGQTKPRVTAHHDEELNSDDNDDDDDDDDDDDEPPRNTSRSGSRKSRRVSDLATHTRQRVESHETGAAAFAEAWQRLNLPSVWWQDDTDELLPADDSSPVPAKATNSSVDASDRTRRRIDVEKVNSAVHDYMDRIDEKLQQMYGIPRSSLSRSQQQQQQQLKMPASVRHSSKTTELRDAELDSPTL
ncbi:hypothetical protein PINS_up011092 [Pythium insidiosum]|nr:hypothetical protein PINS_up011092 [Pythium insidiosum]